MVVAGNGHGCEFGPKSVERATLRTRKEETTCVGAVRAAYKQGLPINLNGMAGERSEFLYSGRVQGPLRVKYTEIDI
jgi:hypothetical protein